MTLKDRWNLYRQTMRAMREQEKQDKERRRQMKVYRTTAGTVFEAVCGLLAIAVWAIEIWLMVRREVIDVFFLVALLVATLVVAGLLVCAYHPHWNIASNNKIENARQLALEVESLRVMALLVVLFCFSYTLTDLFGWDKNDLQKHVWFVLFFGIPVIYSIRISKAK